MQFLRGDEGAGLIEWSLLVVLIAVVALLALQFVGSENSELWGEIGSGFQP